MFTLKKAGPKSSSRDYAKGLIGPVLTYFALEATEINQIVELLQLNTKTTMQRGESFNRCVNVVDRDSNVSKRSGGEHPTTTPIIGKHDLSFNALHDAQAARILQAAMTGPMEGLELCVNAAHKNELFLEACEGFLVEKMATSRVRLRNLGESRHNDLFILIGLIPFLCSGLAHNSLSLRMVTGLLQLLCDDATVMQRGGPLRRH